MDDVIVFFHQYRHHPVAVGYGKSDLAGNPPAQQSVAEPFRVHVAEDGHTCQGDSDQLQGQDQQGQEGFHSPT